MIRDIVAGYVTTNFIKNSLIVVGLLVVFNYCNRQCKREPAIESQLFDYSAIAMSLSVKDSTVVDTLYAKEDLQKIISSEMIEFTKANSSMFARFLQDKYVVENGLIQKK